MHSKDHKTWEKENDVSNLNTYCKIHPYVGLRGKLSLSWIAYPIVSLIFVMLRLFIAMNSVDPIVEDIRDRAIKSCDALELATSTVTSLPHFMAGTFNSATAEAINSTIRGFARTLDLSIQAVNGIIVFFINIYKSTYRCFLELAIRGSISAITEGVKFLQDFSTNTLNGIKSSIDGAINDFNSALNGVRDAIPNLPGVPDIPTLSIPAVNDLGTFTLPNTNVVEGLDALNEGIPTMDEIEKKLTDLVSIPFNELRVIIRNATTDLRFNSSLLPVPEKNNIKFCEENLDLQVLDDIKTDLRKAAWVGLAVLFVLCFLIILANAFYTYISHKRFMRHVKNSKETFNMTSSHTSKDEAILDLIKISEHPILSRPIIRTSNYFKSDENRILYRWFWDYVLHQPAIVCFIIGLSGIIAIYIQLMIIDGVRRGYQDEISDSISNFGKAVTNLMNSQLQDASREYSTQTNQAILNLENDINQNLFGWVNTTTTTLNNTLNTAVDEMVGFVQTTFGGAPFISAAVQELLNCLIIVKIQGIQAGLTFIRDNAFLGLPRVNDTALMVNPAVMDSVVSEATTRLTGDPNEKGTGGQIGRLFDAYEDRLRSELPLFVTLISCWFLVFIFGLIRIIWFKYHQRKYLKNQGEQG